MVSSLPLLLAVRLLSESLLDPSLRPTKYTPLLGTPSHGFKAASLRAVCGVLLAQNPNHGGVQSNGLIRRG
jgi:hypothetical protein